mmetsp:Transcript_10795/g.16133  ORF Transcript_10795/g.16133 Transcript_10795/m.16133 type:complete len:106 (+) Transcript_10795:1411-1728(+)
MSTASRSPCRNCSRVLCTACDRERRVKTKHAINDTNNEAATEALTIIIVPITDILSQDLPVKNQKHEHDGAPSAIMQLPRSLQVNGQQFSMLYRRISLFALASIK